METSSQIGPRVVYIGEILNNIGNFTLSAWLEDLPTELSALGSALASNLLVKIDDGIRKPDVTLLAEDKWTATFSIAPRELSLSFLPPGRNASSAVPGPFVIPLPRTIDTRSARISGSYASIEAKFALAAGPDSSNSWRREIQVHYPLSAAKLEQARGISCARCSTQLLRKKRGRNGQLEMPDEEYFYRTVDLPSEHWMELVECWMCHQEDYGRGGRFEKSTQASPGCLSVGASYVLLSGDDLDFEAVTVDSAEDEDGKPKVSDDSGLPHAIGEERKTNEDGQRKPVAALCASRRYCLPRWNFALKNVQRAELCREGYLGSRGAFDPATVTCKTCLSPLGEAFYDAPAKNDMPTTFRIPLYYISFQGPVDAMASKPRFLDYFLSDLLEDARTHGSYRLLIDEKRPRRAVMIDALEEQARLLVWLLAWDLDVVTNLGEIGDGAAGAKSFRAVKLLYQDVADVDSNPMAKSWLAAPEKLDRLRYDHGPIGELVHELRKATMALPEEKRKLHSFSVAVFRQ